MEDVKFEGEASEERGKSLRDVLDEVNARFGSFEDRVAISEWLNTVSSLAYDEAMGRPSMELPLDADGEPIAPGHVMFSEELGEFDVIAVDSEGRVYFNTDGYEIPDSAECGEFLHHVKLMNPDESIRDLLASHEVKPKAKDVSLCLSRIDRWYRHGR